MPQLGTLVMFDAGFLINFRRDLREWVTNGQGGLRFQ
jgi:hypothetical protein